jgi:Dolichyl-phosphate-mannose-protein mannosyltransferase
VAAKGEDARASRGRHRSGAGGKPEPGAGAAPQAGIARTESRAAEVSATGSAAAGTPAAGTPAAGTPAAGAARAEALAAEVFGAEILAARAPATEIPATEIPATEVPATEGSGTEGSAAQGADELVRVGGAVARSSLARATDRPATNFRSDTLPDWRPDLSRPDRPAAAAAAPDARPARAAAGLERLLSIRGWPLAFVLAVQAVLSVRLVWSATAFLDEGEYLTVGRLELAHFLHHAPMPNVTTYLSGSPIVYPPLAAIADSIGGLAGARLLSLVFMLVATAALYGVTRRLLSSQTAAFFAAALFGWLGTAQFLGAFATYDAMALMLLALATWLGVRAIEADGALRYTLLCAAGLGLAAADAAKYASALFNPVVLAVVTLAAWRADGRKAALDSLGAMVLAAAVPLTVGYDLGGPSYGQGITSTTLTRAASNDSVRAILDLSAHATGIIAVLGVLGALLVMARRPGWTTVTLAWALAAAEFLAPAEQARIHTLTSLFKHVGYGAWFACVMAGYLLAELPALLARLGRSRPAGAAPARPRWALLAGTAAGAAAVLAAGGVGVTVANGQYGNWADSRAMIAELSRLAQPSGYYLVEDPSVVTYYLGSKIPFSHVDSTYTSFNYTDPQTRKMLFSIPAFADSIKRGYFSYIVLAFGDTFGQDQAIALDISQDHDYRLIDTIRYRTSYGSSKYMIWQRIPPARHAARAKHRHRRR